MEAYPVSVGAVLLSGLPTAIFPPRMYRRVIRLVDVQNTVPGAVTVYRGTVGAFTRIFSNQQGMNNQYTSKFTLPAGQGLFVQWAVAPASLTGVRATITWLEQK